MLNIEEKRNKIKDYCIYLSENYVNPCAICPIAKVRKSDENCWADKGTENNNPNIERNYQLLVNAGLVKNDNQKEENVSNFPDDLKEFQKENNKQNTENKTSNAEYDLKHYYGYIFDSLVYRYKLAREMQARYEIECKHSKHDDAEHRANRDICRFIEILNEVMPKHD